MSNKFTQMNGDHVAGIPIDIVYYLKAKGYFRDTPAAHYQYDGFRTSYPSSNGLYDTHIHISKNYVTVYKEYSCGGEIYSCKYVLPVDAFNTLIRFIFIMGEIFDRIDFE